MHSVKQFLSAKLLTRSIELSRRCSMCTTLLQPLLFCMPLWSKESTIPTLMMVGKACPSSNLFQLRAGRSWKRPKGALEEVGREGAFPQEAERAQLNAPYLLCMFTCARASGIAGSIKNKSHEIFWRIADKQKHYKYLHFQF